MRTQENIPAQTVASAPRPNREQMVGWFDPRQLLATAQQVVISSIIGRHADRRLIENLGTQPLYFDFTAIKSNDAAKEIAKRDETLRQVPLAETPSVKNPSKDFWIDYVSDVGDGWNTTYAVARQLTQPQLTVKSTDGSDIVLDRGDILIFGGDEVYPTANRDQYHGRWESPYSEAFAAIPDPFSLPHAFAIPGNHDWYDSLASFSEKFSGDYVRTFPKEAGKGQQGGWRTPQNRSYFAIKLPHDWWLLGVDLQLNHDIDEAQLTYFEKVMERIKADADDGREARVIFCSPEPYWIYADIFEDVNIDYKKSRLCELVEKVIGESRIAVYLAGDMHHYYRIQDRKDFCGGDGVLRITSGGGGAFLHPTHGEEGKAYTSDNRYEVQAYPDQQTSRRLTWGNWLFLYKNPWFGLVTGPLYLLTAWFLLAGIGKERDQLVQEASKMLDPGGATLGLVFNAGKTLWGGAFFNSPFLSFLCLAVIVGFYSFTDPHAKRTFRYLGGPLHGALHLGAAGLIGWLGCVVFAGVERSLAQFRFHPWIGNKTAWLAAIVWIFLAGAIVGATIMGVYLWFSLNILGYHSAEGSSLKIEGYKNFLRIKISADGRLTIYPIGLDDVPRWSDDPRKNEWETVAPTAQQPSCFQPRRDLPKTKLERFAPRLIDGPLKYPLK